MHELSVTQSVLEIALRQTSEGHHITDLYLVVGQLSSMVDDSVQFYWDIISEGTVAQGGTLHFRRVPAEMQCWDCGQRYKLGGDDFTCPKCGSSTIRLVSGDEFYLEAIEIETDQVQV
jgi:hydrogenase nickel incorporation protein HypA/HybF